MHRKGLEAAIPNHLRSGIPRTNVFPWRNEAESKYLGHDLNNIAASESESFRMGLLQTFAANKTAKQAFRAWCRIAITVKTILVAIPIVQAKLRFHKAAILSAIESVATTISKRQILKMLNISRSTYQTWKHQLLYPCASSAFFSCLKIWPQQTTRKEVATISEMLNDPAFAAWPIRSIAWHALRTGKLSLSVQTWYKYARLIGVSRKMIKKVRKATSIRATKPNQIWHADVTLIRTRDGIRSYCYLVVDNFSRKILKPIAIGWHISTVLSASIRVRTLREAAMPLLGSGHAGAVD